MKTTARSNGVNMRFAFSFYLHFTEHPNFFRIVFVFLTLFCICLYSLDTGEMAVCWGELPSPRKPFPEPLNDQCVAESYYNSQE